MDERLKQRLVGATVLVALAVIIIPELLEQPEQPPVPAASLEIPEPPPVREQPVITLSREPERPIPVIPESASPDLTVQPAEEEETVQPAEEGEMPFTVDQVSPPLVAEPQQPPPPTGSAIARDVPPEPEQPVARREPAQSNPPQPAPEPPPAAPAPLELPKIQLMGRSQGQAAAPATEVARAEPAPSSTARGWMVQVGSFSRQENATLQRERLAAAGYPVRVEPVRINGRTLYRVRVGPQGSRAESERVLARLLRETGINGQVIAPD